MEEYENFESPDGFIGFSKRVCFHSSRPVRLGEESGPPGSRFVFQCKGSPLPPLTMDLADTRRLIAALVNVLAYFEDPLATSFQPLITADKVWSKAIRSPVRFPRKKLFVVPSRSRSCPTHPISDRDVWQLVCLLRNCTDHEMFLRFIGMPDPETE